jgi:hypothetical protein
MGMPFPLLNVYNVCIIAHHYRTNAVPSWALY